MKKRILSLAMAAIMSLSLAMTSLAGQWTQDTTGWQYQNDDGSHPNNGWNWIDGKCYYFTPEGYCLMNTQTPDGYQVDASGAWIIDGVVQTQTPPAQPQASAENNQQSAVTVDTLTFTPPSGFRHLYTEDSVAYFANQDVSTVIFVASEAMDDMDETDIAIGQALQEIILDAVMEGEWGKPQNKTTAQFPTGTWYCYQYANGAIKDVPGSVTTYARLSGNHVQMIAMAGNLAGIDTGKIMNDCLK